MSTRIPRTMVIAGMLAISACSTSTPVAAPTVTENLEVREKGGSRDKEVTIRAAVENVDVKNRRVTLRGYDGTRETIQVGEEVRNLAQLKKGDEVVVTYYQSVAFQVIKPGDAKLGVAGVDGLVRAEPGEKPGAVGATVVVVVADILKLDRTNQTAVLKTDKGEVVTVNIQRPEVFDQVKVGERVAIKLTEALAVNVEEAPKK